MRWLFPGKEVRLDVPCLSSGEMMTIRFQDDTLLETSHETIVGHMNVPFAHIATGEASSGFA